MAGEQKSAIGIMEPAYVDAVVPGPTEAYGSVLKDQVSIVLTSLRRNKYWVAGIIATTLLAAFVLTMLMVPKYIATSRVLVELQAEQIINDNAAPQNSNVYDVDRFLQTQADVLKSRALALRVVDSEKLARDPGFYDASGVPFPTHETLKIDAGNVKALDTRRRELAADIVQANMTVDLPVDSRIMSIGYRSANPAQAARVANAFAENFISSNLTRQVDSSSYARAFLQQQLEEARRNLEVSERDLNQYSRVAGLIRVAGQSASADQETTLSVTNDSLIQLNTAASQATADRIAAEDRWNSIAQAPVLSITQVMSNQAVQQLVADRGKLEAQLAQERARHLEEYPTIQALKAQIAGLNRQIDTVGNSIKRSVQLEYEAAKDREQSLLARVNSMRGEAMDEQDRGVQYKVLKRIADTNRALYDTLLNRYNQLNATAGSALNNISLVDSAEVPTSPSSPKLLVNLLLAFVLGSVVAVAFAVLREVLDDAIRSPADVEAKLGLTLLGVVPREEVDTFEESWANPKSGIREAYSSLTTSLRYRSVDGLPATILVTSTQAGEGKSTTARAISESLARNGKRVLLVDADLRRPTLHAQFEKRSTVGLTAVLAGDLSLEQAIHPSGVENLSYMTALPIPPEPTIMLGSARFEQVLRQLGSMFDTVVLDGPPVLGLSDTPTIATQVQAVLFVVNAEENHHGGIKTALRRLAIVHANVVGTVLTKFDPNKARGEYQYYDTYYYSYGARSEQQG